METSQMTTEQAQIAELGDAIFASSLQQLRRRLSRLFMVLLPLQWLGGIVVAWTLSPYTPSGQLHEHVWTAVIQGALLSGFPLLLLWRKPESTATRHVVAVAHILASALLIHLTGGRIETHFHIFGSLAFLALYLDARVLASATITVAIHHLLAGLYWPELVYGVATGGLWRTAEHAGWVVFEVAVLSWGCRQSLTSLRKSCQAQASVEVIKARIELTIQERTAQLRAAEQRFRSICGSVGVGVFEVDAEGVCHYTNPANASILGHSAEEIVGKDWRAAIHVGDLGRLEGAVAGGFDGEVRVTRGDGEERVVRIQLNSVCQQGQPCGAAGTLEDVTERTQLREERTRALKVAEETARIKGEFLANVSHELRTPLHGIIGMTELVLATQLGSDQRDYVETAKSSAEGLVRVVDDILDFSKMESGQLNLVNAPFHLERLIQTTIQMVSFKVQDKNLELFSSVAPGTPTRLNGDAARLRQVLGNLLGNAVKFTDAGEIALEVGVEETGARQATLHFSVRDTGPGIPREQLETIFRPFEQADNATTRMHGGMGMGLTICSHLVTAMGGKMWVESAAGHGSMFHFTVRFGLLEAGLGPRVLLVEDQPIDRRMMSKLLSGAGLDVTAVATGREALDKAAATELPFDLIVLAEHMRSMNGLELLRQLRQLPMMNLNQPALIVCTGTPENREEYLDAGVKAWVKKPLNREEIVEAVEVLLDMPGSKKAPESRSARILVAEDNPVNQKLAKGLLEKQGYTVTIADNGAAAVELVENEKFDLCLMDMHMPLVDGLEATTAIRQLEQATRRHMPIIAMTANAMLGHRETCLAAGMDDYISKPVSRDDLMKMLNRWLLADREAVPIP